MPSNFYNSTNMGLPVPTISVDPGPDWAANINAALTLIDSHDHSPGKGVPVTPAGLNITSDLTFAGNNATTLRSVRFQSQSAALALAADVGCLYEVGNDLYYNDGTGAQIRITQSGSVTGSSGTITGLPSGTASASFAAATFTFNASTNTGANMSIASLLLRNNSAGSHVLTLSPPSAMAADFALTLPSLPGTTNLVSLDSSGNFAAVTNVDNVTLQLSSNVLSIKNSGVGTSQIADASITSAKLNAITSVVSASTGNFSTASGTFVDVTNAALTYPSTGRPLWIGLIPDQSPINVAFIGVDDGEQQLQLLRDGTVIWFTRVGSSANTVYIPPSAFFIIDNTVTAGSHTYKIQTKSTAGFSVYVRYSCLYAYEIR